MPGVNHPVLKDRMVNHDPREVFIRKLMSERGEINAFHEDCQALVQALYDGGVSRTVYCVNIDAVIAALLLKMVWRPYREGTFSGEALEPDRRATKPPLGASAARLSVFGITVLMAHHEYSNTRAGALVDHGVGKTVQREGCSLIPCRSAQTGLFGQQAGNSVELVKKADNDAPARVLPVATTCIVEVEFRARMKGVGHPYSARSRAKAAAPSISATWPVSISASRWAATASQARSLAVSSSRLRMSRSSNLARSAGESLRTCASIASSSTCISHSRRARPNRQLATSR